MKPLVCSFLARAMFSIKADRSDGTAQIHTLEPLQWEALDWIWFRIWIRIRIWTEPSHLNGVWAEAATNGKLAWSNFVWLLCCHVRVVVVLDEQQHLAIAFARQHYLTTRTTDSSRQLQFGSAIQNKKQLLFLYIVTFLLSHSTYLISHTCL